MSSTGHPGRVVLTCESGVMMAYWVDYGFSRVNSAAQFRVPLALQIVFAVVTLAGILVLPESPRWVGDSCLINIP